MFPHDCERSKHEVFLEFRVCATGFATHCLTRFHSHNAIMKNLFVRLRLFFLRYSEGIGLRCWIGGEIVSGKGFQARPEV
jgi:hypothetical protein